MTQQPDRFNLTLGLEGEAIALTVFRDTFTDLQQLIRMIERAQLSADAGAHWTVDASNIRIGAYANGVGPEDLQNILDDTYESLRSVIQSPSSDSAELAADPRTAELARRIVNRMSKARSQAPAIIDAPGQDQLVIEPATQDVALPRSKRRQYIDWSSVDGKLELISIRKQPHIIIEEIGSTNQVRCIFPDGWMPLVKDLLGHYVTIEGLVHYRADGSVSTISEPTDIHELPEPRRSITEFRGTLPELTGAQSSFDYIRQLRTGENA